MTKVKICGLMKAEHVKAAAAGGADAVGFVFAPSRREITLEKAQELAALVPQGVWKVGVVTDASKERLHELFTQVPLDYIQYHGDETAQFIREVGLPAMKALSVRTAEDAERAAQYDADYYIFDTPGVEFKGGSGKTFDWSLLAGIPRERMVLAGGLHAGNVSQAIQQVQPYMVDVSSGVETDKEKDIEKIQQFLDEVKGRSGQYADN